MVHMVHPDTSSYVKLKWLLSEHDKDWLLSMFLMRLKEISDFLGIDWLVNGTANCSWTTFCSPWRWYPQSYVLRVRSPQPTCSLPSRSLQFIGVDRHEVNKHATKHALTHYGKQHNEIKPCSLREQGGGEVTEMGMGTGEGFLLQESGDQDGDWQCGCGILSRGKSTSESPKVQNCKDSHGQHVFFQRGGKCKVRWRVKRAAQWSFVPGRRHRRGLLLSRDFRLSQQALHKHFLAVFEVLRNLFCLLLPLKKSVSMFFK